MEGPPGLCHNIFQQLWRHKSANAAVVAVLLKPNGVLTLQKGRKASEAVVSGKDVFNHSPGGFGKSSVQRDDAGSSAAINKNFQAVLHLSRLELKSPAG